MFPASGLNRLFLVKIHLCNLIHFWTVSFLHFCFLIKSSKFIVSQYLPGFFGCFFILFCFLVFWFVCLFLSYNSLTSFYFSWRYFFRSFTFSSNLDPFKASIQLIHTNTTVPIFKTMQYICIKRKTL